MKKIGSIIILLAVIIGFCFKPVLAILKYQEVNTSQGKVIVGLSKEEAYQLFGVPSAKGETLWYYTGPDAVGFFVNFSQKPTVLLYPDFFQSNVGVLLEFKAFLSLPDSQIREITSEVQLVFDRPDCAKLVAPGVILPKEAGEFSALAIYNHDVLSNPFNLQIKEVSEGEPKDKQELLSIDILPYRPTATVEGVIDFMALGTFFDHDLGKYLVKDLSREVIWSKRQRPKLSWEEEQSHRIYFLEKGQAEVSCTYKETESFFQRVQVKEQLDIWAKRLKHLLVLPESMMVMQFKDIELRVFGTYYDNSVMELTQAVEWKITDPAILESKKNGYFFAKAEGITEIIASKDGVEALAVKVVVNKSTDFLKTSLTDRAFPSDVPAKVTVEKIKNKVEKLKKDLVVKKKELREIKITPKLLEIGLGEKGKFTASGVYSDGSSSDLTILGAWGTLNKNIATVSGGEVSCISTGETSAYVEFKGVRSDYARLVVGSSRLVSLVLTPQSISIARDGQAQLKVQGNYYDHTQKELTAQVSWGVVGPEIVKIEKGILHPLKFGQTKVYAEYSRLRSNTASVDVIMTPSWCFWSLFKIILILLLGIFLLALILFLLAQNKKSKLLALKDRPREFIIGLHENAIGLITIFGLRYNAYTLPLFYAELAKQKFLVEDNVFLNFSKKFEEAKYSRHVLDVSDVRQALQDYNSFFERLCKNKDRMLSLYRLSLALLHCRPIFIR